MSGVLYEEIFDIKDVDPEGKQFERVQRIHAECESSKMELILDVNSLLYVPHTGEKVCPTQINFFYPDPNSPLIKFTLDHHPNSPFSYFNNEFSPPPFYPHSQFTLTSILSYNSLLVSIDDNFNFE